MLQPASTLPSEGVTIDFLTPRTYKKVKYKGVDSKKNDSIVILKTVFN
jgi:hypothetical protein